MDTVSTKGDVGAGIGNVGNWNFLTDDTEAFEVLWRTISILALNSGTLRPPQDPSKELN
jgi:hypothetical protein